MSIVEGVLRLHDAVRSGADIRRRGEDAAAGDRIVDASHRITPATVGALASFGVEAVSIFRRPRFALFASGDELGSTIPDANGPMIAATIADLGFGTHEPVHLRDDESAIIEAIGTALDADGTSPPGDRVRSGDWQDGRSARTAHPPAAWTLATHRKRTERVLSGARTAVRNSRPVSITSVNGRDAPRRA